MILAQLDSINKQNKASFTISARGKSYKQSIRQFMGIHFSNIPIAQIESIFGFVEKSTLYGGRAFDEPQLSTADVKELNALGIGLRIPFTNHFTSREEYLDNSSLLKKYHHKLNSVICTNDDLAMWIRDDFPNYDIEASVIKNITQLGQINDALKLYTTVVLPMISNDDDELLDNIIDKDRIRLFANAGCAYTCPARICYKTFSKVNKYQGGELKCSQPNKHRETKGMIDFDLTRLQKKGFYKFKLLRALVGNQTGY